MRERVDLGLRDRLVRQHPLDQVAGHAGKDAVLDQEADQLGAFGAGRSRGIGCGCDDFTPSRICPKLN